MLRNYAKLNAALNPVIHIHKLEPNHNRIISGSEQPGAVPPGPTLGSIIAGGGGLRNSDRSIFRLQVPLYESGPVLSMLARVTPIGRPASNPSPVQSFA